MLYIITILFIAGLINIYLKKENYLLILLCLELIIISLALYFIFLSVYFDNISGIIYSIYILIIGATESAIGLSIIIIYYKYIKLS